MESKKTVTLDFGESRISRLIFTNSKEEAERLIGQGYVIYFPSELVEIESEDTIFVLGDF